MSTLYPAMPCAGHVMHDMTRRWRCATVSTSSGCCLCSLPQMHVLMSQCLCWQAPDSMACRGRAGREGAPQGRGGGAALPPAPAPAAGAGAARRGLRALIPHRRRPGLCAAVHSVPGACVRRFALALSATCTKKSRTMPACLRAYLCKLYATCKRLCRWSSCEACTSCMHNCCARSSCCFSHSFKTPHRMRPVPGLPRRAELAQAGAGNNLGGAERVHGKAGAAGGCAVPGPGRGAQLWVSLPVCALPSLIMLQAVECEHHDDAAAVLR